MITIRPGSHVHRLLQLLSTAGEIPMSALSLLGNERVLSVLVHKLESVQDIRFDRDGEIYRTKLIHVSGKKGERQKGRAHNQAIQKRASDIGWLVSGVTRAVHGIIQES